jgi:hypothetical protein
LEDAVRGPTIRAIEWAFHTRTAPWRAASIRLDLMAVEATAANSAVSAAAIPARQLEAALAPGWAQADGAPSTATTGRQTAMPAKQLRTLAGEPRKVLAPPRRITAHPAPRKVLAPPRRITAHPAPRKVSAMRRRTIAHPPLRTRGRAVRATPPRDPIHRRAAALLHRPAGAFPARDPSPLPAPQEEASPVDIRASLEGGIPETEDTGGSPRRIRSGDNAFSDGVQDQLSEAMQIQFLVKVPAMRFDGVDTNVQSQRDFLVRFAFRQQL